MSTRVGQKAAENGMRGQTHECAGLSMLMVKKEGLLVSGISVLLRLGIDEGEVGGMVENTETKSRSSRQCSMPSPLPGKIAGYCEA